MVDSISNAYAAAQGATKVVHRASLAKPIPAPQRLMIAAQLMDSLCYGSNDVRSILTAADILCGKKIDFILMAAQEFCEEKDPYGDDVDAAKKTLAELKSHIDAIYTIFSKDIFKDRKYAKNARITCTLLQKFIQTSEDSDLNNKKDGAIIRNFTASNPFLMLGVASEVLGNIERTHRCYTYKSLTDNPDYAPLNNIEMFLDNMRQFLSAQAQMPQTAPQSLSTACAALERITGVINAFAPKFGWNNGREHSDLVCAMNVLKNFLEPYNQPPRPAASPRAGEIVSFADAMAKKGRVVFSPATELAPAGG